LNVYKSLIGKYPGRVLHVRIRHSSFSDVCLRPGHLQCNFNFLKLAINQRKNY